MAASVIIGVVDPTDCWAFLQADGTVFGHRRSGQADPGADRGCRVAHDPQGEVREHRYQAAQGCPALRTSGLWKDVLHFCPGWRAGKKTQVGSLEPSFLSHFDQKILSLYVKIHIKKLCFVTGGMDQSKRNALFCGHEISSCHAWRPNRCAPQAGLR